jgi:hypothetical protein
VGLPSGEEKNLLLVGSYGLIAVVMESSIFWDIIPCNRLHLQGRISRARYQRESRFQAGIFLGFLTLKMEAVCSSETSVDFQRTTLLYIPEDIMCYSFKESNPCSSVVQPVADRYTDRAILAAKELVFKYNDQFNSLHVVVM